MTLSCPVCADLLLVTDSVCSTICGHIFHESCLSRWLNSNKSCPHCRQPCTLSSMHRIFFPESHFEKNDIMEKLTEMALAKHDLEKAVKEHEKNHKKLEYELKSKKKQYQKILNRSRRIGKHSKPIHSRTVVQSSSTSSGPSSIAVASTSSRTASTSQATAPKNNQNATTRSVANERSKKKRNTSRVSRAKAYFRQKKEFYRSASAANNTRGSDNEEENEVTMAV